MSFIKSFVRGLASIGFKSGLLLMALITATLLVFGTSTPLKQALRDSKIYDNLVDNIITTSNQKGSNTTTDSSVALEAPAVKQAAKTAFNSGFIKDSAEQIIDSVYTWLHGKSAKPDFRIDLTTPKLKFATAAADNAAARARTLPACTLLQIRELAHTDTDPFNIPCLPPGTDVNLIRNKVISDLANNEDFIKNPIITVDNLPKDSQGKTALDNIKNAPKIFHWFLLAPWVTAGLAVFSGVLLIILYDQKRRGLRALGIISLGSGIFLLIGTWIYTYALNQVNQPHGQLGKLVTSGLQANFIAILRSLSTAFSNKLYLFGAGYVGLGLAVLLALHFTKPTDPAPEPIHSFTDTPTAPQGSIPERPEGDNPLSNSH